MELLSEKMHDLYLMAQKHEACVRLLGERDLIGHDVLAELEELEAKTRNNTKYGKVRGPRKRNANESQELH